MTRSLVWLLFGGGFCVSWAGAACSSGSVHRDDYRPGGGATAAGGDSGNQGGDGVVGEGGATAIPDGRGVGEACRDDDPCRRGLTCGARDLCEPSGDREPGDWCVIGAECRDGQCLLRHCAPAGANASGEECSSDADCAAGLRCTISGLSLTCAPEGRGDLGAECDTSVSCFGGLACLNGECSPTPPGVSPWGEAWTGVECAKPVTENVKAYFEVPGAEGADEGDFFRLPFPTDVRRSGGKLDLSGFPTPGRALLGVDPVQRYVDAITESDSAWGTYPTIIMRFSGSFDPGTFTGNALQFLDVTDPANAHAVDWQRFYTTARTHYVCNDFVAVQPATGRPLEPGHTYAVFIPSQFLDDAKPPQPIALRGRDGAAVVASTNMAAVLQRAAPADPKLKAAHAAFAPLREYLAAVEMPASNVLTATVFTVGEVRQNMAELAAATLAAAPPVADRWVRCGGGRAVSPCPQAEGERACGDDVEGYDEYQALLSIPVFQQGKPPYLDPEDGGGIDVKRPHYEQVCLSLTVPEGAAPAAGWPAVVFAHGTGGNYRDHVRDEVAGVLAQAGPRFAVLGIDQVEHGSRRGDSEASPNQLFFNFLNPAASRGNPLQGAADQLTLMRFAQALDVDAATSTGVAIRLDPTKLLFFGHSQGSTEGSLMLPFGDGYQAAVLSGNGAGLRDALYTKTKPQNVAAALPVVLQDPSMLDERLGQGVTRFHPVLSLLQQWIDPADPLNFAALLGSPLTGHRAKHVFSTFGSDDSYSPPLTLASFAIAGGLVQVAPDASARRPFELLPDATEPVGFDATVAPGYAAKTGKFTLGIRQYGPPKDRDGHFVVFDTQAANDDMVRFLTTATGGAPPVIGE